MTRVLNHVSKLTNYYGADDTMFTTYDSKILNYNVAVPSSHMMFKTYYSKILNYSGAVPSSHTKFTTYVSKILNYSGAVPSSHTKFTTYVSKILNYSGAVPRSACVHNACYKDSSIIVKFITRNRTPT